MKRENIDGDRVFAIHNYLSAEECGRHIQRSEALGFATLAIEGEVFPGFRNNARLIVDDPGLADMLWAKEADFVPPMIDSQPAGRPIRDSGIVDTRGAKHLLRIMTARCVSAASQENGRSWCISRTFPKEAKHVFIRTM